MNGLANFIVVLILCCLTNDILAELVRRPKVVQTLNSIAGIEKSLSSFITKNDKLALFLDYDGTLSAIANTPSEAKTVPESKAALKLLSRMPNVYLAIISGRSADDACEKVKLNITYAGNHGLEIHFPNRPTFYKVDEDSMKCFSEMDTELNDKLTKNGAWVENKKYSLTFHYRNVESEQLQESYKKKAFNIIKSYGWRPNHGLKAVEAKPPIDWDKGKAVLHILNEEFKEDWASKVRPVFIGDDTTDEDVMRALHGKGRTFRVTHNDPNIETYADYCVPSTETVPLILKWLQTTLSKA